MVPDRVEPDLLIELVTITLMNCGTVAGGVELLPGLVAQLCPQLGGLPEGMAPKPLKLLGADPPLSEFCCAHCAPQNVT